MRHGDRNALHEEVRVRSACEVPRRRVALLRVDRRGLHQRRWL